MRITTLREIFIVYCVYNRFFKLTESKRIIIRERTYLILYVRLR